ncbi:MAG: 16S rRNA (guanine(966)-N(2))-methyltransferase RsmD [Pseudomonadota bacterium]
MPRRRAGGQVRIIAGHWRGRRLPVADAPGLRPSGDAVRETLFNWLAPHFPGARCLDLFAGSGALGFEAASRGARRVDLVERDREVARQLQHNAGSLAANTVEVHCAPALDWLVRSGGRYDIVFVDPPFSDDGLDALVKVLAERHLNPGGELYIERPVEKGLPALPAPWSYRRDKRRGQVTFGLAADSGYTNG